MASENPSEVKEGTINYEKIAKKNGSSIKEIKELHEAFAMFDEDGDESITAVELGNILKKLGQSPSNDELKDMINEVDQDGNGKIDFEEFCSMMAKTSKAGNSSNEDELKEAFKVFDKDGNGKISHEELKTVMESLGENLSETEVSNMIQEADLNGDGQIDYSEFIQMMNK